jgi:hypothetical protein
MTPNRYLIILNSEVVAIAHGNTFESSGYTGEFLKDYDTVVVDNEETLVLGELYVHKEVAHSYENPANALLRATTVEVLP